MDRNVSIDCTIYQSQRKLKITKEIKDLIKLACLSTLESEALDGDFEVTVTLVSNKRIHEINLETRGIDSPTDVLSFPLSEDGEEFDFNPITERYMLGDIVISCERASEQAYEFEQPFEREVAFLCVHSMLHLLGYDHVNSEEEELEMREHQRAVMSILEKTCEENGIYIGKRGE